LEPVAVTDGKTLESLRSIRITQCSNVYSVLVEFDSGFKILNIPKTPEAVVVIDGKVVE
jgi:hypothetical protein